MIMIINQGYKEIHGGYKQNSLWAPLVQIILLIKMNTANLHSGISMMRELILRYQNDSYDIMYIV